MSSDYIRWYSMNRDEEIEEQGRVELEEAVAIVERYFARVEGGKEAGAEGEESKLFGFYRAKTDFIEFCVNGRALASYRFEMLDPDASWFRKLFNHVFQFEETLTAKKAVLAKVKEFFTTPMEDIKKRLKRRWLW